MFPGISVILDGIRVEDLNRCWLAATNPRFLRESRSRDAIEEIAISNLCMYMDEAFQFHSSHLGNYMTLRIAINLLFGMLRIYRQQIQTLYEKTMILMHHPGIQWVPFEENTLKRKATSAREKNVKTGLPADERVLAEDFLSELYSVLELNEQEKRILDSQAFSTSYNDLNLLENYKLTNQNSEDLSSSNIDDFGILSSEEKYRLMEIIPTKRRHNEANDTDDLDCTRIFKRPRSSEDKTNGVNHTFAIRSSRTEYFETIHLNLEENMHTPRTLEHLPLQPNTLSSDFRESSANQNPESSAQIIRTPHHEPSCNNYEFFGGVNGINICATSTPITSPIAFNQSLVYIHKDIHSQNLQQKPAKKRKNGFNLKFDKEIEISERKYIQQFDIRSTLRTTIPCQDVVSLSEVKMQNSKKLFEKPCHMFQSALLVPSFRKLALKITSSDVSILKHILNKEFTVDINLNKNAKWNSRTSPNTNLSVNFFLDENDEPLKKIQRLTDQDYGRKKNNNSIHVEKVVVQDLIQIPQLDARHQKVWKTLNKLWRKNYYPINMSTICAQMQDRKAAAIMFFMIIELSVKGYIEIEKNLETQGIHNIRKKVNFRY